MIVNALHLLILLVCAYHLHLLNRGIQLLGGTLTEIRRQSTEALDWLAFWSPPSTRVPD